MTSSMADQAADSGLANIIAALRQPAAYPDPVGAVEVIQTHISVVFLAGDYAYKLKKPVDFGFLDFTTPQRRLAACQAEVRLNRRLCAHTYLGVVEVRATPQGLRLGGADGRIVDYVVKMRRLPADRMLDALLPAGQVSGAMIDELAGVIARFHDRAERGPRIDCFGSPESIAGNWRENFEQTREFVGQTLAPASDARIRAWVSEFQHEARPLFMRRVAEGRVRDCHGDLRLSAVCFRGPGDICVYDCIEFNDRFRYSDVAADVAFLAMDFDRHGRPDLGRRFVRQYVAASGDIELLAVVSFYQCYRAFVRAKVESFQTTGPEIPVEQRERAAERARRAFVLADAYTTQTSRPRLMLMAGLSGTGKSALAARLAAGTGATVVASDVVRKALAGHTPTERLGGPYGSGIYGEEQTERTYAAMHDDARSLLDRGYDVILDATYARMRHRSAARDLAACVGASFICVECVVDAETVRRRLVAREADPGAISDADVAVWREQRTRFEPITELGPHEHIVVDTAQPLEHAAGDAFQAIV